MTTTIGIAEYRALQKKRSNTRHNERTTVDGYAFDSKAEAARYAELKLLAQAGAISDLRVHQTYVLQEAFRDATGRAYRAITYEDDFQYQQDGRTVVEDVKGFATQTFKIKRKLFLYRYPHIDFRVLEV